MNHNYILEAHVAGIRNHDYAKNPGDLGTTTVHVQLVPEEDNEYDRHAVRIVDYDGRTVGYLPANSDISRGAKFVIFRLLIAGVQLAAILVRKDSHNANSVSVKVYVKGNPE